MVILAIAGIAHAGVIYPISIEGFYPGAGSRTFPLRKSSIITDENFVHVLRPDGVYIDGEVEILEKKSKTEEKKPEFRKSLTETSIITDKDFVHVLRPGSSLSEVVVKSPIFAGKLNRIFGKNGEVTAYVLCGFESEGLGFGSASAGSASASAEAPSQVTADDDTVVVGRSLEKSSLTLVPTEEILIKSPLCRLVRFE